jgi:hypothetical protein
MKLSHYLLLFFINLYSCAPIHNKNKLIGKANSEIIPIKTVGYYFTLDYSKDYEDKFIVARLLFKNGRSAQIWNWGRLQITKHDIKIQYFYNDRGSYYLIEEKGKVISANSFKIKSVLDYKTKRSTDVNILYSFEKYNIGDILKHTPSNL